jgi:hypothetical protein
VTTAAVFDYLRIWHAATLLSPDGAYSGPIRVSLNQSEASPSKSPAVALAAAESGLPSRSRAGQVANIKRLLGRMKRDTE